MNLADTCQKTTKLSCPFPTGKVRLEWENELSKNKFAKILSRPVNTLKIYNPLCCNTKESFSKGAIQIQLINNEKFAITQKLVNIKVNAYQ